MEIAEERKLFSNAILKRMIVPLLVEQGLMLLVGMIDTLMVSYAGEAAVSGVSLVNQINAVFIALFTALAAGGAVVISQYLGRKDKDKAVASAGQLMLLALTVSITVVVVLLLTNNVLLHFLFGSVEQAVMDASRVYLIITVLSFPALAVYNSGSAMLRSISITKVTMYISILMNMINIVGNAIGIFVLHAGVAGVAVPTLISRSIGAIIMFIICMDKERDVYVQWKDMTHFVGDLQKRIVSIAIPNGIEGGMLDASKVALSSIVALFGTVQIAANGVAQSLWSVCALFSNIMGPVFITVVGRCMGAKDIEAAHYYVRKLMKITVIGCTVWSLVTLALIPLVLQLYNLSDEAIRYVMILCIMHNLFSIVFHPFAFALANALRAAGDVKYTMYTSIFATVVVRVILSLVFGVWMNLGVIGVALAMGCDWCVRTIMIALRYKGGKWEKMQVI